MQIQLSKSDTDDILKINLNLIEIELLKEIDLNVLIYILKHLSSNKPLPSETDLIRDLLINLKEIKMKIADIYTCDNVEIKSILRSFYDANGM